MQPKSGGAALIQYRDLLESTRAALQEVRDRGGVEVEEEGEGFQISQLSTHLNAYATVLFVSLLQTWDARFGELKALETKLFGLYADVGAETSVSLKPFCPLIHCSPSPTSL